MASQKELRDLCVKNGIKYSSHMNKKTMCEKLGIEYHEPEPVVKVILTNTDTGEVRKYFGVGEAAKDFNVNPGNICHFTNRVMHVNGEKWHVKRLDTIKPRNRQKQEVCGKCKWKLNLTCDDKDYCHCKECVNEIGCPIETINPQQDCIPLK